jgi:hypothetical protein
MLLPGPASIGVALAAPKAAAAPAVPANNGAQAKGLQLLLADSTLQRSRDYEAIGKYALVVGVNEYANKAQGISSLRFAVGDAEAVYQSITDPRSGGFKPENVTLLTDKTTDKPTSTNIGKALNRLITATRDSDLVIIYFSGHGYEEEGRAYLLPANADLEALDYSAIERDAFVRQIDKIPAKKVIVVLDACHSGGVNRGGKGVGKDAALSQKYYEKFQGAQGRAFIASSSGGELSWEDEQGGHGVFTQALARALAGAADTEPRDGIVTLQEVRKYLETQVTDWAGRRGKEQHPQIDLESARGDIPLAINYSFFEEQSHDLTSRREEADKLNTSLSRMQGLEPAEVASALEIVSRFGRGEVLAPEDGQQLDFMRRLADGSITVEMYRAGIPHREPKMVTPGQLGLAPKSGSFITNKWFLGGLGVAVVGVAAAAGGGSKASAPKGPVTLDPPPPPPGN